MLALFAAGVLSAPLPSCSDDEGKCVEEGMDCPNHTSNPATQETWSEECLDVCATLLAR